MSNIADQDRGAATLLQARNVTQPDGVALWGGEAPVTYQELYDRAGTIAAQLPWGHQGRTDIVPLIFPTDNSTEAVVAYIAAQSRGLVPSPLPSTWPSGRLDNALATLGARGYIDCGGYHNIGRPNGCTFAHQLPNAPLGDVLWTSGTTSDSVPVATPLRHLANAYGLVSAPRNHRLIHCFPMYSAAGVRVGIYTALARGAASAKTSPLDPDRLIYLVGEEPTQIVFVTPSLGRLLLRVDLIDEWGHDVRLVRVVGDICSAELLKGLQRAFRRAHVANMYGLTEGGLTSSSHYGDQKVVAVGKASRDGRPVVVRRPGGEICTVGETGEITMKVGSDAPFYVLPPYEGRTRTHAEWLWTGDFGFLDQDGYVYVSGRYADTIISAGRKIAPVAVESSLTTVGDDLVVFGIQHAISGQVLAIATTDSRVSLHTCKNVLSGEPAWTPRCLLTVPRIFRNSMGKASRGALAQWLPQRPNERIQDGAMADELQILQGEVRANGAETAVYETTGGGLVLCVAISNDSSSSFNQLRRLSEKGVAVATANTHRFFDWHLPTGKAW